MPPFIVLISSDFTSAQEVETAVQSLARFYYGVTSKHRKQIHFCWVEHRAFRAIILQSAKKNNIQDPLQIVCTSAEVATAYLNATLFFSPIILNARQHLSKALAHNLPVLGFEGVPTSNYIDNTCGILLSRRSTEYNIAHFAMTLEMLYFDPEALKMLQKGAKNQYMKLFSWRSKATEQLPKVA